MSQPNKSFLFLRPIALAQAFAGLSESAVEWLREFPHTNGGAILLGSLIAGLLFVTVVVVAAFLLLLITIIA